MAASRASSQPLIVGAGPVGTAAALFLAHSGIATRVVDRSAQPSPYSRALAVSPRTLELLEPTGVTSQMLTLGLRIGGARFWHDGKPLADISFDGLIHKYPFMLALSQATTERLLDRALAEQGGTIERGVTLTEIRNSQSGAEAILEHASDGAIESTSVPWLFAADGAHSTVRHALSLGFAGTSFADPWHLVDVPLSTSLDESRAHITLFDDLGFLFMMRVVTDAAHECEQAPLWRIICSMPDPLAQLSHGVPLGAPVWASTFYVVHRIVDRFQVGRIYLGGDAAHLHSPVGARGMNLGIEDAYIFSTLAASGQLARYTALRHAVDRAVVKRVERVSRMAVGNSTAVKLLRIPLVRCLTRVPAIRRQLIRTVTGLDHDLNAL